jgi:hypothetical protein
MKNAIVCHHGNHHTKLIEFHILESRANQRIFPENDTLDKINATKKCGLWSAYKLSLARSTTTNKPVTVSISCISISIV